MFPNLRFVWVTREEKARQAVSLWKALQTWTWRRDDGDGHVVHGELQYSFDAIDHLVGSIRADEVSWHVYFAECGVVPHNVVYEDFALRYEEVVLEILDFLGIDLDQAHAFRPPQMTRQSDDLSEEWLARYSADAAARR